MNETMQTILHRRAIRRFDARQLDEEHLQQILQAGLYAPSAGGKQGVVFAVCQDREVNERLGKIKRANSNPHMATATNYVSREQPSIADDPRLEKPATPWELALVISDRAGRLLQTATDRKFCVNGKSAQIIMLSCSSC